MATIIKNRNKNGAVISFRIKIYKGVDRNGKELPPYSKTVKVPKGTSERQLKKLIENETACFEIECKGLMIESNNIRFDEFVDKAMELKKLSGVELSTLSRYQNMLDNRILPAFGHWKVKDITGNHLNKFYKSLSEAGTNKKQSDKGLSQKTVLEYHRLISSILEEARRQHLIAFNPAKDIKVSSSVSKTPNYYQSDEIEKIKKAFQKESIKWRTIGFLMLQYGGRRAEYTGLKYKSIDFKNHILTIDSCVLYNSKDGVYEKDYTKARKARSLPMSKEIEDMLRLYLFWLDGEKARYGDDWIETDYIFTGEKGGLMNPDIITRQFKRITDKNRKTDPDFPHINPHAFRHTVASTLISKGVDVVSAAAYIGDVPTTVSTRYAHTITEAKLKAFQEMNTVIFGW